MCNICIEDEQTIFVFPQENEELKTWMERLEQHEHLALAMSVTLTTV